jgi:hypothetical protein
MIFVQDELKGSCVIHLQRIRKEEIPEFGSVGGCQLCDKTRGLIAAVHRI